MSRGQKRKHQALTVVVVEESSPCYLLSIPVDLLNVILGDDYVSYNFYPVLRLVCRQLRALLPQSGGKYFVSSVGKMGFFRLARWAYNLGAPFDIYWKECYVRAAEMGDIETIRWMVKIPDVRKQRIRIVPVKAFRILAMADQDYEPFLQWLRLHTWYGYKKYQRAQYAYAIKRNDAVLMRRLLRTNVKAGSYVWEECAKRSRLELLDIVRLHEEKERAAQMVFWANEPAIQVVQVAGVAPEVDPNPSRFVPIGLPNAKPLRDSRCYGNWRAYYEATKAGNWPVLRWLGEHGYSTGHGMISLAVEAKDHEMVRFLHEHTKREDRNPHLCNFAAVRGDMSMLELLESLGYRPDSGAAAFAARLRNEECFLWCMQRMTDHDRLLKDAYGEDSWISWSVRTGRLWRDNDDTELVKQRLWIRDILKVHFPALCDQLDQTYYTHKTPPLAPSENDAIVVQ